MKQQRILVEGNDFHVIVQVCIKHGLKRPVGFPNRKDFERDFLIKNKRGANRSKAEAHTWLAWQAEPGKSMGLAVKNNWASAEHPLAARFATWFANLFELEDGASHI